MLFRSILEILKKEIKQKIIIENDVNCASIGFYHQYSHYQNSALIYQTAVDYVGCGMIIQGKLYNGFSHFAGELRCLLVEVIFMVKRKQQLIRG